MIQLWQPQTSDLDVANVLRWNSLEIRIQLRNAL